MYGELLPNQGGDPIPLFKEHLVVGRRESCDIVLRFSNVSSQHCELDLDGGYWYVRDLGSSNGVKVNGVRVTEKRLDPGDKLSVAKHDYEVQYSPADVGAIGPPPIDDVANQIFSKSLLERAGLATKKGDGKQLEEKEPIPQPTRDVRRRYDVLNNEAKQIKDPNAPT